MYIYIFHIIKFEDLVELSKLNTCKITLPF